jgi:two pore calcium channel protein
MTHFIESSYFEAFINLVNVSNLVVVIYEQLASSVGEDTVLLFWIQVLYIVIYLLEMFLKLGIYGFRGYFRDLANAFDGIVNILSVILFIVILMPSSTNSTDLIHYILLLRLLRILSLLGEVEQYQIIFKTFVNLVPLFGTLMGVILFIFYTFSLIGMQLFGGEVYKENDDIYDDPGLSSVYIFNSFNDFGSGLMTLFELMVVNNW